jgi:hypothetical protein
MKHTKSYTSTPSYDFVVWCSVGHRKNDACAQPPFVAQGYLQSVFNQSIEFFSLRSPASDQFETFS